MGVPTLVVEARQLVGAELEVVNRVPHGVLLAVVQLLHRRLHQSIPNLVGAPIHEAWQTIILTAPSDSVILPPTVAFKKLCWALFSPKRSRNHFFPKWTPSIPSIIADMSFLNPIDVT